MDRYAEIKKRLIGVAENSDIIKAVVAIGSSVRDYSKSDEYSDIDLIIATTEPDSFLYSDLILSQIGDIKSPLQSILSAAVWKEGYFLTARLMRILLYSRLSSLLLL